MLPRLAKDPQRGQSDEQHHGSLGQMGEENPLEVREEVLLLVVVSNSLVACRAPHPVTTAAARGHSRHTESLRGLEEMALRSHMLDTVRSIHALPLGWTSHR